MSEISKQDGAHKDQAWRGILKQAEREHQTLLQSPAAFVFHGFCQAVGDKPGG